MLPVPAAFLLSSLATQVPFHVGEPDDDARDALYVFTCMRALSLLNGPGTPLYDLPQAIHDADLGSSGGAERPWMFPLVVRGADRHAVVVDVAAGYTADELVESGRKAAQRLAGITIAELAAPDASSPGLEPDVAMSRLLLLGGPDTLPGEMPVSLGGPVTAVGVEGFADMLHDASNRDGSVSLVWQFLGVHNHTPADTVAVAQDPFDLWRAFLDDGVLPLLAAPESGRVARIASRPARCLTLTVSCWFCRTSPTRRCRCTRGT